MEFEEQPIIYKCVEAIYQQPKCLIYNKTQHMVKTWSRLQRVRAAMVTQSSTKILPVWVRIPWGLPEKFG